MYGRIQAMLTNEKPRKQKNTRRLLYQMPLSQEQLKFGQKYTDKKGRVRVPQLLKQWGTNDIGEAYRYYKLK